MNRIDNFIVDTIGRTPLVKLNCVVDGAPGTVLRSANSSVRSAA